MEINKPDWKWTYMIPFTKGRSDYKTDRKRYDEWYEKYVLTPSERRQKSMLAMINGFSWIFIAIVTTVWSLLPALLTLPSWLDWMGLGMHNFGSENWGNQVFLTIVPLGSGTILHNAPKLVPQKKGKIVAHIIIKIIPVIILTITAYLPLQIRSWWKEHKSEKELLAAKQIVNVVTKNNKNTTSVEEEIKNDYQGTKN
jgi:uncharacterized membrane protein required for colicin V production